MRWQTSINSSSSLDTIIVLMPFLPRSQMSWKICCFAWISIPARRLVEEQDARLRVQPLADDHFLLVAAAECGDGGLRVGHGNVQLVDICDRRRPAAGPAR